MTAQPNYLPHVVCRRDTGVPLSTLVDPVTQTSRLLTPELRDLVHQLIQTDSWLNPVELYEPSNTATARDTFLATWQQHLAKTPDQPFTADPHLRYQHLIPYFYRTYRDWWSQLPRYPAGSPRDVEDQELLAQMSTSVVQAQFTASFARRRQSEKFLAATIPHILKLAAQFRATHGDYIAALSPELQLTYAAYALILQTMRDDQLTLQIIRSLCDSDLAAEKLARLDTNDPAYSRAQREQIAADRETGRLLTRKYGSLEPALTKLAWDLYEQKRDLSHSLVSPPTPLLTADQIAWLQQPVVTAQDLRDAFVTVLQWYDLYLATPDKHMPDRPGYLVIVSSDVSSIDVRDKTVSGVPTIFIPARYDEPGYARTRAELLQLIGHEIECHARQSANGQVLFGFGGGPLKLDQEDLYEGLALSLDLDFQARYLGLSVSAPDPYYVIAISLAQSGSSFAAVFQKIYALLAAINSSANTVTLSEHAWRTTYRVFRGSTCADTTSTHFALTKDRGYLAGYLQTRHLEHDGCRDYTQLAITSGDATKLLGLFKLETASIPYPYLDARDRYWREILLPEFNQTHSPTRN